MQFTFNKRDLLVTRTGSEGFQPKFFSNDRKYFVKCQASISGLLMEDWLVEIIASRFATQLGIPYVYQMECDVDLDGQSYKGVYSNNFELKNKSFKSFESLLNEKYLSANEDYFIRLDAMSKLEWCADKLSELGNINRQLTLKYMLDLAIVDCLVGNGDRHTRNFGLFYDNDKGYYQIAQIFDSGMGLFENTYYRDKYSSYEEAMRDCYVAPYGEDPFEMLGMLQEHYRISDKYNFAQLRWDGEVPNRFAQDYLNKVLQYVKTLGK